MSFKEYVSLQEGINDPSIFKAIFLAGGPGSGKSFIVGKTSLKALGFVIINSDEAFENLMKKLGLDFKMPESEREQRDIAREAAKATADKKLTLALSGRLGLVIDGTGKDYDKIAKMKAKLAEKGYESAMVFVNTDLETALARNAKRERSLKPELAKTLWKSVQNNIGKFQQSFGHNFFLIDNSEGSNYDSQVTTVYKKILKWSKAPANSKSAKQWIKSEKEKRGIKTTLKEYLVEYRIRDSHSEECDALKKDGYDHAKSGGECHPALSPLYAQIVNKYADVPLKNRVHFANAWLSGYNQHKDENNEEPEEIEDDSMKNEITEGIQPQHIEKLKTEWDKVEKVDPTSQSWKNVHKYLDKLPDEDLNKIAKGKIKFMSSAANLKIVKRKNATKIDVKEEKEMKDNPCWKGYEMVGTKKKNGKKVPNCVPKNEELETPKVAKESFKNYAEKSDIDNE